jgi:hypothetical protein
MTINKIKNIKSNIIIDDARKEIEGLLAEFNGAAARNIELLESKISDLQEIMRKASDKMIIMDEKIGRMNKPIVIEKIVERNNSSPVKDRKLKEVPIKIPASESEEIPLKTVRKTPEEDNTGKNNVEKPFIVPLSEMSRSDKLKYLLKTGKSKEELLGMGFLENEINLISFLMRKRT